MKKKFIAMIAAVFIAAGSIGAGFTSRAADSAFSDVEISTENEFETYEDEFSDEAENEADEEAELEVEEATEEASDESSFTEGIILEEAEEAGSASASEDEVSDSVSEAASDEDLLTVGSSRSGYFFRQEDGTGAYAYIEDSFYYEDEECTRKLKKVWLYSGKSCEDNYRALYLNKSGKPVKGFSRVDGVKYLFDKETGRLSKTTGTYKSGKKYYFLKSGAVVTKVGFVAAKEYEIPFECNHYYVTDKEGVLATGYKTIKSKEYPGGKKYYFESDGRLCMLSFTVKGKTYIVNQYDYDSPDDWGPEDFYVLSYDDIKRLQQLGNGGIDPDVEVNRDGSLYTGWKKRDGKTYYYYQGEPLKAGIWPAKGYEPDETFIIQLDDELYWINGDGSLSTGWHRLAPGTDVVTFDSTSITIYYQEYYFYYKPETGKLAKGFTKAPVPKLDADGNIALDSKGDVVTTDEEEKLYFAPDYVGRFMPGALVRNYTLRIDGKSYTFDGAGKAFKGGLVKEGYYYRYKKANGQYVYGRYEGRYFDLATGYMVMDGLRKSGKKWYGYGPDGKESADLPFVRLDDGKKAFVVFNKDKSIRCFVDGDGNPVTDRAFALGDEYYFLGKKGLPQTGVVNFTFSGETTAVTVYVGKDGKCEYGSKSASTRAAMIKVGKKLYVLQRGMIVTDDSKAYAVGDYSNLPKADRKAMDKYYAFFNDDEKGLTVPVYVNADGSVSAKTIEKDGKTFHINKYGICLEQITLMRKSGKKWYICGAESAGTAELSVSVMNTKTFYSDMKAATVSWDDDLKMGKIIDVETGKGLTGLCKIEGIRMNGIETESNYTYYLKNGVPVTSTRTLKLGKISLTLPFDAETGRLDEAAVYKQRDKLGF